MPSPIDADPNDLSNHDDDDNGDELDGDDDDNDDGDELDGDDDDDGGEFDGEPHDRDGDAPRSNPSEDAEPVAEEGGSPGLGAFLSTLLLGDPFAISAGLVILEAKVVVAADDGPNKGKKFRIDLLSPKTKRSPYDGQTFTHALIMCPVDDGEMVRDVVGHILDTNGHGEILGDDGDDDGDDEG